ncbi:MAG: hypothetical protein A2359_03235 [Candidatus Moranbacteria bacterium RIFOXYB1_FULL_43_19]|nr:MAG: hypothetical protein A2359_03235 [Candidatus Moranbacteria bacterium RIFOXYB1_FULL_43_19]OGI32574.1 MAG: hypothetical protein A2420_03300 [Candidatus Moranbacteria bacterium RIFOXYC1_FULL_44_13]OGI38127.1 MAG: hypothetical protein A2612_02195 [Candidatus Moranbacteria bacterium RIFOXYD1_FULL_44_12]
MLGVGCLRAEENGHIVYVDLNELKGVWFYEARTKDGEKRIDCLCIILYPDVAEIKSIERRFVIFHDKPDLIVDLEKQINPYEWYWLTKIKGGFAK